MFKAQKGKEEFESRQYHRLTWYFGSSLVTVNQGARIDLRPSSSGGRGSPTICINHDSIAPAAKLGRVSCTSGTAVADGFCLTGSSSS